jgi:hypothetical protein
MIEPNPQLLGTNESGVVYIIFCKKMGPQVPVLLFPLRQRRGGVPVGYGCEAEGQEEGHLGCSRIMLKTLEYRNDSFIKISEHRISHILWTDAWLDFFDLK